MSQLRAGLEPLTRRGPFAPGLIVGGLALAWATLFGWLALARHLAGGSHAEDLGFTDQVLWNFLHGQWFRMSIYQGASWNTELDISRIARPDSLLAFHFEPMLLLLVPLYALGGIGLMLVLQAVALAAGALPAYRLGAAWAGAPWAGAAVAVAYLLSPLGQWSALADFHTASLAAPLLLLAVERLVVARSPRQALAAAAVAALAREDVGVVIAAIGAALAVLWPHDRRVGVALVGLGLTVSLVGLLVIRAYSGGASPFDVRYAAALNAGPSGLIGMLARPAAVGYVATLGLSGAWLGLTTPLALGPMLPSIALNVLSASPWMLAGKAHYSALVLPLVAVAAAAGLSRIGRGRWLAAASAALVLGSGAAYAQAGAGPLGADFAPAAITPHARGAADLAATLPPDAAVSATSALVPRLSRRARVFVFPAVEDAEYVFLDVSASPAPTSAGDVFLRARAMLESGGWQVEHAADGLLLMHRLDAAGPSDIGAVAAGLYGPPTAPALAVAAAYPPQPAGYADGRARLLAAELRPSPDGAIGVDGPLGVLRTVWQLDAPLPPNTRLAFDLELDGGQRLHVWDLASLWWNPPEAWPAHQAVVVEIPDVPLRRFVSWQAVFTMATR